MVWTQVFPSKPPENLSGPYQVLIAGYVIAMIIGYCHFYGYSGNDAGMALAVVCAGIALAFYVNFIHHTPKNVSVVVRFIEHMSVFGVSEPGTSFAAIQPSERIFALFIKAWREIGTALHREFGLAGVAAEPFRLVYWLTVGGIIGTIFIKNLRITIIAAGLLALGIGMEAFNGIRYWAEHYRIYSEPWILLAGATTVSALLAEEDRLPASLKPSSTTRRILPLAAATLFVWIIVSSVENARSPQNWQPPERACAEEKAYLHRMAGYFCQRPGL